MVNVNRYSSGGRGAELIAPAPWFARFSSPTEGEPPYEMPCAARRGRVEDRGGVVLHFCTECGTWGSFGFGVNLRGDPKQTITMRQDFYFVAVMI
jgi:hypothetical protein